MLSAEATRYQKGSHRFRVDIAATLFFRETILARFAKATVEEFGMSPELDYKVDGDWKTIPVDKKPSCPWCEQKGEPQVIYGKTETLTDEENYCGVSGEFVFECKNSDCSRMFLALYYLDPSAMSEAGDGFELVRSCPSQPIFEVSEMLSKLTLPSDVLSDIEEATSCLKNDLYQAFGSMARRAMHSICADKNAVGKDLQEQIEFLRRKGLFTNEVADRAQELRTAGRHGAHPEWEPVDRDLANEGMKMLVWVVQTIYQPPPPLDRKRRTTAKRRYSVPKQEDNKPAEMSKTEP